MKSLNYRLLAMIVVILVIGAIGLLTGQFGSLDWLVENENRMRASIRHHPWRGWVLGFLIYTGLSLIPGTGGKSVVCGWLFGFWQAVLMVDLGLTFAAIAGFLAIRLLARDVVHARWNRALEKLNSHLEKDGAFYLLMMRLAHVPYSFVNYAAGTTSLPLRTFCWTTALGILPGTMIFVFVGTRIPTLRSLAENGVWELFDPLLFGILAATVVFPVLIRWAVTRYRQRGGTPGEIELLGMNTFDSWNPKRHPHDAH